MSQQQLKRFPPERTPRLKFEDSAGKCEDDEEGCTHRDPDICRVCRHSLSAAKYTGAAWGVPSPMWLETLYTDRKWPGCPQGHTLILQHKSYLGLISSKGSFPIKPAVINHTSWWIAWLMKMPYFLKSCAFITTDSSLTWPRYYIERKTHIWIQLVYNFWYILQIWNQNLQG